MLFFLSEEITLGTGRMCCFILKGIGFLGALLCESSIAELSTSEVVQPGERAVLMLYISKPYIGRTHRTLRQLFP